MHSSLPLSSQSVAPHLRCLRWCGFCQLGADSPAVGRLVHKVYCALVLTATSAYLLQQIAYAYQALDDMEKLARVMFLLLCHVTSLLKQLVFYARAERVDAIITGLADPAYNVPGREQSTTLRETARSSALLQRVYSGTAVVTCTLWISFPIMYRLQGLRIEFPFWTPFDVNHSLPSFVAVLAYSYYVTTLVGIANTTMDAFMGTILFQCKSQLKILRMNLETLPERAYEATGHCGRKYEATLWKLFVESLEHYSKINHTTRLLQDTFGTAILVQFGIGGWILCMAAYKLVSLKILSMEFASMVLFIICILTELFLYCYYGNEVTAESERLTESLYAMRWSATPVRFRRALVLTMERAKRPLRPVAGRIVPLSLDTFVKIIKSSYTFYAVLRQTK